MLNLKAGILCKICNKVFKEPVKLPCDCIVCFEHVDDLLKESKNNWLKCSICLQDGEILEKVLEEDQITKRIIEANAYLTDEEKTLKKYFQNSFNEFKDMFDELKLKETEFELIQQNHFVDIQNKIYLTRDALKMKIDKLAAQMIEITKKSADKFRKKAFDIKIKLTKEDIQKVEEKIGENFRNLNVDMNLIENFKAEQINNIEEIKKKLDAFEYLKIELKNYDFESNLEYDASFFGMLKLNGEENRNLATCSSDGTIKLWNLKSIDCIKTLKGHTSEVFCIEIPKNNKRLISGSDDNSIKIWDLKTNECIKTLYGHNGSVMCLKLLSNNQLVSGSFDRTIKIWDIENGICHLTLNGHKELVTSLEFLPNGDIVSGSNDKSIKIWELKNATCILSLLGHLGSVKCLKILSNNELASGSSDCQIKIWNFFTGDCIYTLKGHSNIIWDLDISGKNHLVSCSDDKSIKIWNLKNGNCIHTFTGHKCKVYSIKIYSDAKLASGSGDGCIKLWDLKTGKCISSFQAHTSIIWNLKRISIF